MSMKIKLLILFTLIVRAQITLAQSPRKYIKSLLRRYSPILRRNIM